MNVIDLFLSLHPILAIFIISLIYTLFVIAIYSLFTDIAELRRLKKEMDEVRKKILKTKNEKELEKLRNKTLELSLKYNQHSMKTMLLTTLPAIFLFGFLINHYTYEPLRPNEPFNITIFFNSDYLVENLNITQLMIPDDFVFKGIFKDDTRNALIYTIIPKREGSFEFKFKINNESKIYSVPLIVTNLYKTSPKEQKFDDPIVQKVEISYKPLRLVNFKIFGFYPGRITFYLVFSLILNILFRKWFKIP